MGIDIKRIWQSEWVFASEGLFNLGKGQYESTSGEARAVIGQSEKGFHIGIEEIRKGEQLPLRWSGALPSREGANREGKAKLNDWLRDNGTPPTQYEGQKHKQGSKEESDGWAKDRSNTVEVAFKDVSQRHALFSPGEVSITPEAFQALKEQDLRPDDLVNRHIRGDWSAAPVKWMVRNEASVAGEKDWAIISIYQPHPHGPRICVGTDGDRSSTSITVWPHVESHGPLMSVEKAERQVNGAVEKQSSPLRSDREVTPAAPKQKQSVPSPRMRR